VLILTIRPAAADFRRGLDRGGLSANNKSNQNHPLRSCATMKGAKVRIREYSQPPPVKNTVKYTISDLGLSHKALRLAESFAYRNPIVQYPDRPSRENPFANRDKSVIEDYRALDCIQKLTVIDCTEICEERLSRT
jgi:hypothetical protein